MKIIRSKIVHAVSALLLLCSLSLFITTVNASSVHVTFNVNAYVAEGYFSTDITSSGDKVNPGGSTTITFEAKQGQGSLYVDMGTYGSNSISFKTPLSSISIPVSGIPGVASANVDLRGSLEGDLTVNGPGTLSTNHLSWSSWGKKTVTLDATNAKEGDTITITLNLKYTGHIGAHGDTFLGDVTLVSDQALPGVSGSKSVDHTVKVTASGVPGFEIAIVIVAIAAVALLHKKLTKK